MSGSERVTLRPLRWWDVPAVVALERALFPDDPWTAEQAWSELAGVPDSRWYVVVEGNHQAGDGRGLVGYAGLWCHEDAADVQTLAVAPQWQGLGTGRLLLGALLDEAARRHVREVLLEVRADNSAALRLYAGSGFERIGIRRGYYAAGQVDALVLRRRLRGGAIIGA